MPLKNQDFQKLVKFDNLNLKIGTTIKQRIIEVHGTDKNLSMDKLNQCYKWVTDYEIDKDE